MTLDLDELTFGWDCPPGELRARVVVGRDGLELVQLRVDLGVMQMCAEGRPDGNRFHGLPSAREYIEHESRVGGERLEAADWQELERELIQTNYRRLAYSTAAEDAFQDDQEEDACRFVRQALADIEICLVDLRLLSRQQCVTIEHPSLRPTLVFDRARLSAQLSIVEGDHELAVEQAEAGAVYLEELLAELEMDEDQREEDPGLRYLRGLSQQLRKEYGVGQTLRERLEEAIEKEDFEAAARLRDELEHRENRSPES